MITLSDLENKRNKTKIIKLNKTEKKKTQRDLVNGLEDRSMLTRASGFSFSTAVLL